MHEDDTEKFANHLFNDIPSTRFQSYSYNYLSVEFSNV